MIFLNRQEESVVTVDKDLVLDYKRAGDEYLIDIKRELSKQLVYYILYTDLQQVYNAYGCIIEKLLNEEYTEKSQITKDNADLSRCCASFLKSCEGFITESVLGKVKKDVDALLLCIKKLMYIIENLCIDDAEGKYTNEVRSVF